MKTFHELQEGVYDPNIFKAFFLAGGPGSGKSYVVRKTTGGIGLKSVNSDDVFEKLLKDAGLSLKMPPEEFERKEVVRSRAKALTVAKQKNYIMGRLGLIIDGTGKDYDKISQQSTRLKQLGYDTHMIFVNTSLDVALQRNAERSRSLPEPIVVKSWKSVQSNLGKFSQHFRGNLIIVDNNDAGEDIFTNVFKQIKRLLRKKVKNPQADEWMYQQMKLKKMTKIPKGFSAPDTGTGSRRGEVKAIKRAGKSTEFWTS
jgi:cytidylate kinase